MKNKLKRWRKERFIYSWVIHYLIASTIFLLTVGAFLLLAKETNYTPENHWLNIPLAFIAFFLGYIMLSTFLSPIVGQTWQMTLCSWGLWPKPTKKRKMSITGMMQDGDV